MEGAARECSRRPASSPRTCSRRTSTTSCSPTTAGLGVAGVPASALSWGELAAAAKTRTVAEAIGESLRPGMEPALAYELDFDQGEVDVPVRRARRRRRDRPRDRARRAAPPRRGRRLRTDRQPDARRGPAARRHRAGRRAGAVRGRGLRRRRQPAHRATSWTTRCRAAAELPSFEASNTETPTPAQPARREGHRRVGDDRFDAGGAERGDRRGCRTSASATSTCRSAPSGCGRRSRSSRDATRLMAFAPPTVAAHRRRSTARIVAHCYFGLAGRGVRAARRPGRPDGEPTGVVSEVYPCAQRRRVGAYLHRRLARLPPCVPRRRSPRRRDRRRAGTPTPTPTPYPSPTDVRQAVDPMWIYVIV